MVHLHPGHDTNDIAGIDYPDSKFARTRVVLFDEPSEGLAPQIVEKLRSFFVRLKTEGLSSRIVRMPSTLQITSLFWARHA
jgi:hypothetical protein